ncbi:MAG: type II secretion system F family protein [Acidimicrobiia bacterium]
METSVLLFGVVVLAAGLALVARAVRPRVVDAGAVLTELDMGTPVLDEYRGRLAVPLVSRLVKPLGRQLAGRVGILLPRNYLDATRHKLVVAGVSSAIGPEEFVVLLAVGAGGGLLAGLGVSALLGSGGMALLRIMALLGVAGAAAPRAWLRRRRDARQDSVRKDLPDVLDLMAISVEAGVGLEGAVEVVTRNFDSPLGHELSRTLREMELGLPRREALQNLKRRVEVAELSNFVLILVQADALGMPIGRVLRTQATQMRSKRRQWAREKAGKLPVKLLIPLVLFILPALFVVILGPVVPSIMESL